MKSTADADDSYNNVMIFEGDGMSTTNTKDSRPENSSGPSDELNTGPRAAAPSTTDGMLVNEQQSDSNGYINLQEILQGPANDHTYGINPFTEDEPLHHINHHSAQPTMVHNKAYYRDSCKMLSIKVKYLKDKLAVLLAQQGRKEISQACVQTDPIEGTTQDKLNKQLMSKYEQALKEIHHWKVQCKALEKIKSEPVTTPTKEKDVNSRSNVDDVYSQLKACCIERDQYKSEIEQLKQQKLQMDSEISQFRTEVEQLTMEMQKTASTSTPRDKRQKSPSSPELSPAPVKKPHVTVLENSVLPYNNNNSFNISIHDEDNILEPDRGNSKLHNSTSSLTTGSISTATTPDSNGSTNFQESQQIPNTNDYDYCNRTTPEMDQSSVPAGDHDKEYYRNLFQELSDKVEQLENQLAVTLGEQVQKGTSSVCIRMDPIPEASQESSRMQLESRYEKAIKEVQTLQSLYDRLQKSESKTAASAAMEDFQSSGVDKIAVQVDQVFRQLVACCTERDLYKSEIEELNQQISQLDSKNGQLRSDVEKLREKTEGTASSNTSGDTSTKLQNLRMNLAHVLTMLVPDLDFGHLSCNLNKIDDILHQVLKET